MSLFERFSKAERLLHWTTVVAVTLLGLTGWFIWRHEDDWEILGINVLSQSHVVLGAGLLVAGLVLYLVMRGPRRSFAELRFNLGQQLSLRLTQALITMLTVSGTVLYLRSFLGLSKAVKGLVREVHFYSAAALLAFVGLHLVMVLVVPKNRGLVRGMWTGRVSRKVALRVSPAWVERQEALHSRS